MTAEFPLRERTYLDVRRLVSQKSTLIVGEFRMHPDTGIRRDLEIEFGQVRGLGVQ